MAGLTRISQEAAHSATLQVFDSISVQRKRGHREFFEQEIVIPSGPYKDRRFKTDRQPFAGVFLDLLDTGAWNRIAVTGPSQSGKTLLGFVGLIIYTLFEAREDCVILVPDFDMAADKWAQDIRPCLEATRYATLIPKHGIGLQGGRNLRAITFPNGATARFMSGKGSDKSRAGFTAKNIFVTETDGMDDSTEGSKEADPITQTEARIRAYGSEAKVFLECTVSYEDGRIWQEYKHRGTATHLLMRCPHCECYVHPERKHFTGWQDAESVQEAKDSAHFICPSCEHPWTPRDRRYANSDIITKHKGQTLSEDERRIEGEPTRTDTLGFRWSPAFNMLYPEDMLGADEWLCDNAPDEKREDAEKKQCQFVWCVPYVPPVQTIDITPLSKRDIVDKATHLDRFKVPEGHDIVVGGVDIGGQVIHWGIVSFRSEGFGGHVCAYGEHEVPQFKAIETSILAALRELREELAALPCAPQQVFVDAGWQTEAVYAFCRETGRLWLPSKGFGKSMQEKHQYMPPPVTIKKKDILHFGQNYHVLYDSKHSIIRAALDADHWKEFVHNRFRVKSEDPSAFSLHRALAVGYHGRFARHIMSEKRISEFTSRGEVIKWEQRKRANHFLDVLYQACAAGHMAGARLLQIKQRNPRLPSRKGGEPQEQRRAWVQPTGRGKW